MSTKQLFIKALETRLAKLRLECDTHIADSRQLMAKMFAEELGYELEQVITFCDKLYVIKSFQLDIGLSSGISIGLEDYSGSFNTPRLYINPLEISR